MMFNYYLRLPCFDKISNNLIKAYRERFGFYGLRKILEFWKLSFISRSKKKKIREYKSR